MQRKTKAVLAGAGFLTLLGLGWRASRAKAAPPTPEEVAAAGISIEILGPDGQPVPHNSPATVVENTTYTVRATVTNMSTRAGVAVAARFVIRFGGTLDGTGLGFNPYDTQVDFAANQTLVVSSTLYVPAGAGGMTGQLTVDVIAPTGYVIATATELLNVSVPVITYAAGLTITVS